MNKMLLFGKSSKGRMMSLTLAMVMTTSLAVTGCSKPKDSEVPTETTTQAVTTELNVENADTRRALIVGSTEVYLDEVLYYAYTSQATYEVYYLTENETLDWDSIVSENITLEEAAKNKLFDDICRREAIIFMAVNSEQRDNFDVTPTEDMLREVQDKVKDYLEGTNSKLQERIGISETRLQEIYLKDAIYNTVLQQAEDAGIDSEEMYSEWKKDNAISMMDCWYAINFREPIFESLDDAE